MTNTFSDFFKEQLNPPQLDATLTVSGPLLILAGAGSGKTRVITYRLANLIATGNASPDEILCVTFTNKAAKEMESRACQVLMALNLPVHTPLWISTFHATCVRILREHIELLEYQRSFTILDSSDQLSMIKKILTTLNISDKMYPAKNFQLRINAAKMEALTPEDIEKSQNHFMDKRSVEVYRFYEKEMTKNNALDFSDLLFKTFDLFRSYPDILEFYQNKFRYIMVDEYQDTNHIQYRLINMLAEKHQNLCVVGDEDQSIYSWRGADISNILDFEKDYPHAKTIKLEENYRSTQTIISAATHLIQNNTQRKNKKLFTSNIKGERIVVREENNEYDEARFVVKELEQQLSKSTYQYKDISVFYRTNAQSRVIEEQLRSYGIPYKIVGGVKFYERMEIKDLLAYLRLINNINDDIALKRIINTPARGIGKTTVSKLEEIGFASNRSLFESIDIACIEKAVNSGTAKKLQTFKALLITINEESRGLSPSNIYQTIIDQTKYVEKLQKNDSAEAKNRLENLEELNNALVHFEKERGEEATLTSFLEEIALVSDIDRVDSSENSITLMTLHISKGLEFPVVFIVGMEDGLFPSGRSFDSSDPTAIEEERRLAYVGITRAKEKLFLSYVKSRRLWGNEQCNSPSRFLKEIPNSLTLFLSSMRKPKTANRRRSSNFSDFDTQENFPNYEDISDDFNSEETQLQKGVSVRHPTFGPGDIFQIEGSGEDLKVSVKFSDRTIKKFVVKYARLEIIGKKGGGLTNEAP